MGFMVDTVAFYFSLCVIISPKLHIYLLVPQQCTPGPSRQRFIITDSVVGLGVLSDLALGWTQGKELT
jgi:hypothetical protein